MICSLRSVFLLPVALAMGASFCLAQTGSITRIEENDASIAYSGDWNRNVQTSLSGGSAMLTNGLAAKAVVTFTGTGISWIGVTDSYNGPATVTIDGRAITVDSSAAATHFQTTLFTVSGLPKGPHKLSIEIKDERTHDHPVAITTEYVGKHNAEKAWVWVDAFDIHDGMGVAGGLPAATAGRIEDDNPAVTYTGFWNLNSGPQHSGGTAVLAMDARSAVSLTFNGTGIQWIAYRDQWSGIANVIVDGEVKDTIDTFLPTAQARAVAYRIDGLNPGNHTLRIEVPGTHSESSGGSWIWLDAFEVVGSTTAATQDQTPTLFMDAAEYCVGGRWSLQVSNAVPAASVRLLGASNGQSWMVPEWRTTDAGGSLSLVGAFGEGSQGSHRLAVEIGGKISNTVPVVISNCGR